jgi:MFS family permease
LRQRDFRLAMCGQVSSQVGDAMTSLGLAQVLLFDLNPEDTTSAFLRGLVVASFPLLFVGPLAGFFADRFLRQRLLTGGQMIRAILTLGSIAVSMSQQQSIGFVTFGLLLLLTRVLYTVRATSIPRLVERRQLVAGDSISLMLSMAAGFAGVAIAAGLAVMDVRLVFIVAAVMHIASSDWYRRIRTELGGGSVSRNVRDWQRAIAQLRNRKVRYSIVSSGGGKFLLGACFACVALILDARFTLEATGYAAVFGVAGAGTFLGTVTAEWVIEHVPRKSVCVLAAAVSSISIGGILLIDSFIAALGGIIVAALAFQNMRVCNDAAVQSNVDGDYLGRVFATYDVVYNLAFVLGALLALSLGLDVGYLLVLGICCVACAALALALLFAGSGEPRPTTNTRSPAEVHSLASSTFRVSNTTFPVIAAATWDGSILANSGHSVSTSNASAPKHAPMEVSA